ncbi:hypothetical protein CDL15_Pgr006475 [Punica granatum]|uniref:Uncharacterized protein n=1 Tax=Punica granatum TaxID=22663 RepID=A0A218XYW2_PUNGR|nr:hypothetical protein CDL15_Pgr006475 [Punica granatum]
MGDRFGNSERYLWKNVRRRIWIILKNRDGFENSKSSGIGLKIQKSSGTGL